MVIRVRHYLKIDPHRPNIDPKSFKNGLQMVPKCFQNAPKMVSKWSQTGAWSVPKLKPDFGIDFERNFSSTLAPQGTPKTMKNMVF